MGLLGTPTKVSPEAEEPCFTEADLEEGGEEAHAAFGCISRLAMVAAKHSSATIVATAIMR